MSAAFTGLLGMVVLFIGGALVVRILVRLKAKKTIETLRKILLAYIYLYAGLAGYYTFLDVGFLGGAGCSCAVRTQWCICVALPAHGSGPLAFAH